MSTPRHGLSALALTAAVCALSARADPGRQPDPRALVTDSAARQAQLKRQFETFRRKLVVLAGRLENGTDQDKQKAKALRAAVKVIGERGVDERFDSLIRELRSPGAEGRNEVLAQVLKDNKELRDDLKKLIALLSQDDRDQLRERLAAAERLLARLKELRARQARLHAQTEQGRRGNDEIGKDQGKLTRQTQETVAPGKEDDPLRRLESSGAGKVARAVRTAVGNAVGKQKEAQGRLGRGNRAGAGESQEGAVGHLDEAINHLEDLVNQTRREEIERLLTNLKTRLEEMLRRQVEVRDGTVALDRELSRSAGGPSVAHAHSANKLADKEDAILRLADSALKLLENEGSAVAFVEVLEEVKADMQAVRNRLGKVDAGTVTQTIENDVIETLKEMIEALKKSIRDNGKPPPHPGPRDPRPPKPPLVDLLAQLKMIYSVQRRIHTRTEVYGRQYKGEQAPPPRAGASAKERQHYEMIQKELKDLAARQQKLGKVTRDVAVHVARGPREMRID